MTIIILIIIQVATKYTYGTLTHLKRFNTEYKCRKYLIEVRWKGLPTCPKCGNNHMNYYLRSRECYKCSKCYKQFTITSGTMFHGSKLPLTDWFYAIYLFTTTKRGLSSIQLAKALQIQQRTAWYMLQRLRLAPNNGDEIILKGIIESDETLAAPKVKRDRRLQAKKWKHTKEQIRLHGYNESQRAKRGIKLKRGRKKGDTNEVLKQRRLANDGKAAYDSNANHEPYEKGSNIFGMLERGKGGRLILKKLGRNIKSTNRENIFPYLKKHIAENSILVTDELSVYKSVSEFINHQTVNHSKGYVDKESGTHINGIENTWMHLKLMLRGTYFHVSYHHADGYLNEFEYRFNHRDDSEKEIFESFMPFVSGKGITYRELMERRKLAA